MDRLPTLTVATSNQDTQHDFKIGLPNGRTMICRLMEGYKHAFDGVIWAMQTAATLKDHYTDDDRRRLDRLRDMEPILNGAIVKITGLHYRVKVLGDFSDAAIFQPLDEIQPQEPVKPAKDEDRMTPEDFKAHRAKIGWTQKQAAEGLGLTIAQISAIENGRSRVSKTASLLFRLYHLGDWPGRPSGTKG